MVKSCLKLFSSSILLLFISAVVSGIERPGVEVRYNKCYAIMWWENGQWYTPWWKSYSPFGRNWLHFSKGTPVYIQQVAVMFEHEGGGHANQIVQNNDRLKIKQWHAESHLSLGSRVCTITPYYYDYWGSDDSVHRGDSKSDIHSVHKHCISGECQYGLTFTHKYVQRIASNSKSGYGTAVNQNFRLFEITDQACKSGLYECLGSSIPELRSINGVNNSDTMNPDIFYAEDAKQKSEQKAKEENPGIDFMGLYGHPEQHAEEGYEGSDEEAQENAAREEESQNHAAEQHTEL